MSEKRVYSIPTQATVDLEPLRRFIREKVIPGARERDQNGEYPRELYRELHALGWLEAFVPEPYGGLDARTIDLIWAAREISYGSPGMATSFASNMAALIPILHFGGEALRQATATRVLGALSLASFCFTEPDAGSDIQRVKTRAVRTPEGYRITGQKCLISNANYADHFTVVARVEGVADPRRALTAFYVPASAAGLGLGKPYEKMGHRDSNTSEVFFDNVLVPEAHRIGSEGEAVKILFHTIGRSRTLFSAAALGLCQRASDLVRENLATRIRYGKPLLSHPTILNLLAQLHTEMTAAWYLVCAAGAEWDAGNYDLVPSSMAKLYSGQTAVKFVSGVLELIGGWGYLKEFEIERLYRDAKLYEIIEGPSLVQQAIIAKGLFPEVRSGVTELGKKAA